MYEGEGVKLMLNVCFLRLYVKSSPAKSFVSAWLYIVTLILFAMYIFLS